MIMPSIIRSVLKPFAPAVAVASLASLALVHSAAPAAAKMTQCQVKHSFCTERCIMFNSGHSSDSTSQVAGCLVRTCDHQFKACARESGESMDPGHGLGGKPGGGSRPGFSHGDQRPDRPARPGRPLGGGILESTGSGGLPGQGPASTGSPVGAPSAPAAPPVILR
jgi:hypothetical protein